MYERKYLNNLFFSRNCSIVSCFKTQLLKFSKLFSEIFSEIFSENYV